MSSTTLLTVPAEGPMEGIQEFRNSWGSAMRVWVSLAEKYCGGQNPMMIMMNESEGKAFWDLASDPRLFDCERMAMAFTFDKMICEREKACDLAAALREFNRINPAPGKVNHLSAIAEALESHADDDCVGFAFIQTSVCGDAWYVHEDCRDGFHETGNPEEGCPTCDGEKDEDDPQVYRMFDWSKDRERDAHFLLFEEYETLPAEAVGG